MYLEIPNRETLAIKNIILDFNGTLAVDGELRDGIAELLNQLAKTFNLYIVTADTYGTVTKQVASIQCELINLSCNEQFSTKGALLSFLGEQFTAAIGNGVNDSEVLKMSALGIAVLQQEGLATKALLASDIVCHSIYDALKLFENVNRLKATLRA